MINYFHKYGNREEGILNHWIDSNPWIKDVLVEYKIDHTPYHDWKMDIDYNGEILNFTIHIKEEEIYWYEKTGNLGLDFISAFYFKRPEYKIDLVKNNYCINSSQIENFLNNQITVSKWGKLYTCDSNIHIFYVEDKFCRAYSNNKLKSKEMINYLKLNYKLRVNKKNEYGLSDDWESAAFFVKPNDLELKKCEINTLKELILTY